MNQNIVIDETHEPINHMIEQRLPWLAIGLFFGVITTFIVSGFENILSSDIRLAFFIPIVVYMSGAVSTQSETIFVRYLTVRHMRFAKYFSREIILGVSIGLLFGSILGGLVYFWLHSIPLALTVGVAMCINISIAPLMAIIIPAILKRERQDPALGAGPLATVMQDLISISIYLLVASIVIF